MISPTNYHIPSHVAEGLAQYHTGGAKLESVIPRAEVGAVYDVLADITDPRKSIAFGVGQIAGHNLLLIDDHDRPAGGLAVQR